MDSLLPEMPAVRLTSTGRSRVAHGQRLLRIHYAADRGPTSTDCPAAEGGAPGAAWVRLLDGEGRLVGLAQSGGPSGDEAETLHPSIVLI
jgi:hypothetical protein